MIEAIVIWKKWHGTGGRTGFFLTIIIIAAAVNTINQQLERFYYCNIYLIGKTSSIRSP